eukprot:TRINITY_DN2124_c0_g1_i2.p1 TRINITY_DN2124_c0_g1~~TRINITY_DN2124_c0_g1_i2.p1  ORF type:complete len:258 (-),score=66.50 TRINITY_DN2124_c0_g1_i2:61-834(-)
MNPTDLITLDPHILLWVLFPITLVMFMQGIIRQYISELLASEKTNTRDSIQKAQILRRSQRIRSNSSMLSPSAWMMRKKFLTQKALVGRPRGQASDPNDPMAAMGGDPFASVNMMKQQLSFILPQMLSMAWVSYFFSGFLLVKLPFPLTNRFKSMLQRGIMLKTLDASYVSSLSWYFLNFFGLRGLSSLILGVHAESDEARMMQAQMQGFGGGGGQPDADKLLEAEKTEVEIQSYEFHVPHAEYQLIGEEAPKRKLD